MAKWKPRLKLAVRVVCAAVIGFAIGAVISPNVKGWVSWLTVAHPAYCAVSGGWPALNENVCLEWHTVAR